MLPRHSPGRSTITAGRYIDRFEKRNGEWRIMVRRTVIDEDLEGESHWPGGEPAAAFPTGAWDETDVSYARPLQLDSPTPRWNDATG